MTIKFVCRVCKEEDRTPYVKTKRNTVSRHIGEIHNKKEKMGLKIAGHIIEVEVEDNSDPHLIGQEKVNEVRFY